MIRPSILFNIVVTLMVLLFNVLPLCAQIPVGEIPAEFEEPVNVWVLPEEEKSSPFHRQRFEDIHVEKIRRGQIVEVASQMISLFDALDWGQNESKQKKIMNRLTAFLEAMQEALHSEGIQGPLDTTSEQDIFIKAMNDRQQGLLSLRQETVRDDNGNDVPGYFKESADEILLYELDADGEQAHLLVTSEQVRHWRLLHNALSNLIESQVHLVSGANVQALKASVERWENFLDKGYSQMPWEALFNGWAIGLPKRDFGPPDHQWILLHPTVGLELSVDPVDEARIKEALQVEALGHIWYRGKKLENFWGVSATVSLREDLDPGFGVLFHFKRHWNLGLVWHDVDEDPFLFFSVDIFQFAKKTASKYIERYEGVAANSILDY